MTITLRLYLVYHATRQVNEHHMHVTHLITVTSHGRHDASNHNELSEISIESQEAFFQGKYMPCWNFFVELSLTELTTITGYQDRGPIYKVLRNLQKSIPFIPLVFFINRD